MNWKPSSAFLLATFLASLFPPLGHCFQEKLTLKHLSSDLGLPGNTVKTITQDNRGVIWIGLEGGGLSKYNGNEFKVFQNEPDDPASLSSDYVNVLFQDSAGSIWVGTQNGLDRLDSSRSSFDRIGGQQGLIGSIVFDILEDERKHLWVATERGVSRIDLASYEVEPSIPFQGRPTDSSALCNALFRDSHDRIWVATRSGIFRYNKATEQFEPPPEIDFTELNHMTLEFFDIQEDGHGSLWFGHNTGLSHYDPQTGRYEAVHLVEEGQDPEETNVNSILVDRRGNIWVATFSDGIRIIDSNTRKIKTYRPDPFNVEGLKSSSIRSLFEDRNGLIWIGTKFAGIQIYNSDVETFTRFSGGVHSESGLRGSHVLSIVSDQEGIIWIGTKRGGINAFDPRDETFLEAHYQESDDPNPIFDNRVEAIAEGEDGVLWLGTEKGLSRFDKRTGSFENFETYIIRDLLDVDERQLYIGTHFGLQIFDKQTKRFQAFPIIDGIDLSTESTIEIKTLFLDSANNIYIGTHHNGLYRFDPKSETLTHYAAGSPDALPLSGNMVRSVYEDVRGRIWVGTRLKGLNLLDLERGSIQTFDENNGLPSSTVFGIREDRLSRLWLTTDSGICILTPNTGESVSFTEAYGLQGNIFEPNAFCIGADGSFYVGGDGGFNKFRPEAIKKTMHSADIVFSSISVLGQNISQSKLDQNGIELSHNQNYLGFSFALTDYSLPGQNEFSYKLEGLDPDWIYSGRRNYASYTSLHPGNYRFIARGRLPSGEWNEQPAIFSVTIRPPFWQTAAFVVFATFASLLTLAGVYLFLTKRQRWQRNRLEALVKQSTSELRDANQTLMDQSEKIKTQNLELEAHRDNLEEMVQQRTAALEEQKRRAEESDRLKSSFLANMSHEIRTPMNAIIGFSTVICDTPVTEEERKEYSKLIKSNCSSLLSLIDDILDISRIEAGEMKIDKQPFDLHELVKEISTVFDAQLQKKNLETFQFKVAPNQLDGPCSIVSDPVRLRQILINLIGNALKFTDEGHVSLDYQIDRDAKRIDFVVEDTGIGIDVENLSVIWDRFRKLEDEKQQLYRGTGLGLSITKNLVQLLGGDIEAESTSGVGTRFTFHIPWIDASPDSSDKAATSSADTAQPAAKRPTRSDDAPRSSVVIAEDEDSNYLVMSRLLKQEPINLIRANNGQEAIDICRQRPDEIALVLMDIRMPELDGRLATQTLKADFPDLPIVACTAYATTTERAEIMGHGFDAYLSKPVTVDALSEILKSYLYTRQS
ncbi:two-component regulator propeller domain-containing protein [Pelagicoccus sp. SDUM812003]|uniref:hybrid sensor histidine kinase/response regulator n=1 Tax=Pelagicoccus sp. SDUM812003 TaxID=3041267 RepID=UPI00280DCD14|nr:two-component regulator propeller domain-containing protein [Pelagicoccus sp. SDUM812003]MDQ8204450.1 two-component regulator propeller domain-containing protein [Pelagicoccus sp. SDUM812003]